MNSWNESENPAENARQEQEVQKHREWQLLEKAVLASTTEMKKTRRWGILFKALTFVYLLVVLGLFIKNSEFSSPASDEPHTSVVDVNGMIADSTEASADIIITGLHRAYDDPQTRQIILRINSPGGSPVQSGYVYDEIRRLKKEHPAIPVSAVISDTGASGAYYIAAAADNIYANRASVVGSIGVTAAGFGFTEAMKKVGVERRQFTSGEHKAFLDPYMPLKDDEKKLFQTMLNNVHQQFIKAVKDGRGERLKETPDMFSGLFWSGEQAMDLGLIDGLKSTSQVARDAGFEKLVNYTPRPSPLEEFTQRFGVSIGHGVTQALGLSQDTLTLR